MSIRPLIGTLLSCLCISAFSAEHPSIVKEEFIYTTAPFPSCHASTLVETETGHLLAAWFGGQEEGALDVGIWLSKWDGTTWSPPVEVARAEGVPCWNPVLTKLPDGEIILFYKAGPSPREWSGLLIRSEDHGATWSAPELLPAGILGPIKNKPIVNDDGTLICGSSVESWRAWACWIEITEDGGRSWSKFGPIAYPGEPYGIIQPTLFYDVQGHLRMLCRSTRRIGWVCSSTSTDDGKTWSPVQATDLPHPGSGIDAVGLKDGRVVLIYNHTKQGRSPLNAAVSEDGGDSWKMAVTLEDEPGEYSYPAVIQTREGLVHITYTWKRERIKHVILDPSKF